MSKSVVSTQLQIGKQSDPCRSVSKPKKIKVIKEEMSKVAFSLLHVLHLFAVSFLS